MTPTQGFARSHNVLGDLISLCAGAESKIHVAFALEFVGMSCDQDPMSYNVSDAQLALDRLASVVSNDRNKQYEAGKRLLMEIARLKKPTGMHLAFEAESECIEIQVDRRFRRVWFGAREMSFKISDQNQSETTRDLNARIEYDPLKMEFVGIDDDPNIVPTPGAPRRKRDALAEVIDSISRHLVGG